MIRSSLKRNTGEARASVKVTRCKVPKCRNPAIPYRKHCGPECGAILGLLALEKAKRIEAKRERMEDKSKREKLKSLAQLAAEAQTEVNRYVRLRDAHLGCVSCDKPASWNGQWHASHLRSRGAAPGLRFHLWNIHKACSVCNNHLSGNLAEYRPRLEKRIGAERVEWLYSQNATAHYSREYLVRLKSIMRKRANRIAK
jgi:hypothetical protein